MNLPPKMTLHPFASKGGTFVSKLGLVFKCVFKPRKEAAGLRCSVAFNITKQESGIYWIL